MLAGSHIARVQAVKTRKLGVLLNRLWLETTAGKCGVLDGQYVPGLCPWRHAR